MRSFSAIPLVWVLLTSSVLATPNNWKGQSPSPTKEPSSSLAEAPASSLTEPKVSASSLGDAPASSLATAPLSSASIRPTARPTGPVTKNPKRGLAFAAGDSPIDILNANQSASVISWQYDWANIPPAYLATSNIPYVPMQWGSGAIERFVDAVRAQGSDVVLGFNEPDFVNEANMDPEQAASLWMTYIEPLKEHGVRLGGPAVTAAGTGRPWLQAFFRACSRCSIDFLPVHWYGVGVQGFYDYLWSVHNEFPEYPIWVTEYADISENDTEVYNFMEATLTYLDEQEWVERYAWFGFFRPEPSVHYNMLNDDGSLNALGELYIGAETVHTYHPSDEAYAGYQTVDGADEPGRPFVTSWPSLYNGASHGRGQGGVTLLVASAALLIGSLTGALRVLF